MSPDKLRRRIIWGLLIGIAALSLFSSIFIICCDKNREFSLSNIYNSTSAVNNLIAPLCSLLSAILIFISFKHQLKSTLKQESMLRDQIKQTSDLNEVNLIFQQIETATNNIHLFEFNFKNSRSIGSEAIKKLLKKESDTELKSAEETEYIKVLKNKLMIIIQSLMWITHRTLVSKIEGKEKLYALLKLRYVFNYTFYDIINDSSLKTEELITKLKLLYESIEDNIKILDSKI